MSLGGDCQPNPCIHKRGSGNRQSLFDSLGTSIRSLIRLTENDLDGFLEPSALVPIYNGVDMVAVYDTRYGMTLSYDFANLDNGTVQGVRDRYELLTRWFRNLPQPDGVAPYFVRRWHPRDGIENEEDARTLFGLLREKRRDVRLLYLHNDPGRPDVLGDGSPIRRSGMATRSPGTTCSTYSRSGRSQAIAKPFRSRSPASHALPCARPRRWDIDPD